MKEFFVNHIVEDKSIIHGIATADKAVIKNINTMFGRKMAEVIIHLVNKNEDFFTIERFCQYVGFIQFRVGLGLSLKLTDFRGNMDNALDEYLELEGKGWDKADRDKYIQVAHEILEQQTEEATLRVIPEF